MNYISLFVNISFVLVKTFIKFGYNSDKLQLPVLFRIFPCSLPSLDSSFPLRLRSNPLSPLSPLGPLFFVHPSSFDESRIDGRSGRDPTHNNEGKFYPCSSRTEPWLRGCLRLPGLTNLDVAFFTGLLASRFCDLSQSLQDGLFPFTSVRL